MIPVARITLTGTLCLSLALTLCPATGRADDLQEDLLRASELSQDHRFQEIIGLLEPYQELELNSEAAYIVSAEIGRAYFHLGRYREADLQFRRAVKLRPNLVETALYLQATSYLMGQHEQAFSIFRAVLQGGARDLWLATTLPGEQLFLSDPRVWRILQEHAIPLEVDLESGSVLGAALGEGRDQVITKLGAAPEMADVPLFTAEAGPKPIWAFSFSEDGTLNQVMLHAEHLLRYTPYRMDFGQGLDWKASPLAASSILGPPDSTKVSERNELEMSWRRGNITIILVFGEAMAPRPPVLPGSAAVLKLVHMRLQSDGS